MTDPREHLERYAYGSTYGCFAPPVHPVNRWAAPAFFNALNGVMGHHHPMPWFHECDCDPPHPNGAPDEFTIGPDEDHWVCEKERSPQDRCAGCTPDYPEPGEDVEWPCATVQIIAEALDPNTYHCDDVQTLLSFEDDAHAGSVVVSALHAVDNRESHGLEDWWSVAAVLATEVRRLRTLRDNRRTT